MYTLAIRSNPVTSSLIFYGLGAQFRTSGREGEGRGGAYLVALVAGEGSDGGGFRGRPVVGGTGEGELTRAARGRGEGGRGEKAGPQPAGRNADRGPCALDYRVIPVSDL